MFGPVVASVTSRDAKGQIYNRSVCMDGSGRDPW